MIIDVGGIGYHLIVPPTIFKIPPQVDDEVFLFTYLQVREDSWQLFGFVEKEQLEVFRHLISVSGVGARLGLTIINSISPQGIIRAVITGDSKTLSGVPGIGKKIAQRMILELKEKFNNLNYSESENIEPIIQEESNICQDVILALNQLGYSGNDVKDVVAKVSKEMGNEADIQKVIKGALKILGRY